jgi:Tol biopolymer transport system component
MDRDRPGKTLIAEPARYALPRVSPDGRTILVARADAGGNSRIWTLDAHTGVARILTPGKVAASDPAWSPDGNQCLFSMLEGDRSVISTFPLDRKAASETVFSADAGVRPLDWSGSLKLVLLRLRHGEKYEMWTAPLPKGKPVKVLELDTEGPVSGRLSRDGRWIAFTARSTETSTYEVYVTALRGKGSSIITLADCYRVSSGGGFEPEWSPTGTELFYVDAGKRLASVDVLDGSAFHAGAPHVLFSLSGSELDPLDYEPGFGYSISPDGKRFLVAMRSAEPENELTVRRR